MIIVGLAREAFGDLPHVPVGAPGQSVGSGTSYSADRRSALIFVLLPRVRERWLVADRHRGRVQRGQRAPPARGRSTPGKILVTEGIILALAGRRDLLAGARHARRAVRQRRADRDLPGSHASSSATRCSVSIMFFLVQAATVADPLTGGNTSFNGFPFLANFVAEDSFLPRWLTKRGHRLVFSNGIIVLAVLSCRAAGRCRGQRQQAGAVLRDRRVHRRSRWPGSAWPSTTRRTSEPGWRRRLVINFSAGVYTRWSWC